jgi:hypothetical protein
MLSAGRADIGELEAILGKQQEGNSPHFGDIKLKYSYIYIDVRVSSQSIAVIHKRHHRQTKNKSDSKLSNAVKVQNFVTKCHSSFIRVGYGDGRKETTTGQENIKRSETRDEGQRRRPDTNESQNCRPREAKANGKPSIRRREMKTKIAGREKRMPMLEAERSKYKGSEEH